MKKLMILAGAALVALVACNKSETVVKETNPGEITFKTVASNVTKGEEYPVGQAFPTDNTYRIWIGASTTENPNYFGLTDPFGGQHFSYRDGKWGASVYGAPGTATPIYWPIGGAKVDFLAYAAKAAEIGSPTAGVIQPKFDASKSAKEFKVESWNVYPAAPATSVADQIDLLYAVANGKKNQTTDVPLVFKHTEALVIFNFRLYHGGSTDGQGITINTITFDKLVKSGDLLVNNEYNEPIVKWTPAAATANVIMPTVALSGLTAEYVSSANICTTNGKPNKCVNYGSEILQSDTFAQLGEPLLVIPQDAPNVTINYTIGGKTFNYKLNTPRMTWEAGKAYIYDLSFNINEITVAPSVTDWVAVDASTSLYE